uniref:Uncharacterized protein n=1 Tax=Panagrolaimus sp. PS1159 TaxID=55785 RepID=A0AC35FXK7_9BILA
MLFSFCRESEGVYQCGQQDCAEVVGVTACDNDSKIYYLLQSPNGNISLYEFHIDNFVSVLISSVKQFPKIKQLIYSENEFTFITFDGQIGTFDTNLQNIQINYEIKNVKHLLPYIPIESKAIEFIDEKIETSKSPFSNQLEWAINCSSLRNDEMIIYKIQLFKDRFGGERIVDITLKDQYLIPLSILEKWPSQQRYDIIVDAITPWNIVTINSTELSAPTKPPTAPKNLKLFVTQQKTIDGARAIIDLFWDTPDEWNGEMLEYIVNCSIIDGNLKSTIFVQNVSAKSSTTCSFSVKSGKVSCGVAASNEQNLIGKYSDTVSIDSSDVRPLVRLFAIDSTDTLVTISNWSTIWDGVRVFKRQSSTHPIYQGMAFVDNNLYAIRKEDSVQPFAVMLDVNNVENVLHKVGVKFFLKMQF